MLGCFMWPTSVSIHVGCWGKVPGWARHLLRDGSGGGSAGTDPSEPLSAVALAQLNPADKGLGLKIRACKHALHIVVAWYGHLLHALHGRVASMFKHAVDWPQFVACTLPASEVGAVQENWYSIAVKYRYGMKHAQALGQQRLGPTRGGR